MRKTVLPILFACLVFCGNLWAGGLFPGTAGSNDAGGIEYDNTASGLTATNLKDAVDEVATMAGTGGLASVDDLPGDTVNDSKIDIGLLPTGITSSTVALGNHTHSSVYQPLDSDLTAWADVTSSANGRALVSAANYAAMRGLLDLEVGTDFNAYSAILAGIAGATPSPGYLHYTGSAYEWANPSGSIGGSTGSTDNRLLRSDGTGGATVQASAITVDDSGNMSGVGTFSAGAGGLSVDADGDTTVKSLTVAKVSGTAGTLRAYEANSTDTSTVGWMGPASISASWDYQFSSTQPAANSIMLFGAPSSNISAQTWATLDDTGTNGDTAKIWSADKCYDQDALRLALSGGTLTGELITAASTTTTAGLNVPHGTAPTSPVNGDVWTTTAGLYARINGSTVGPFGTGGSMTWPGSAGIAVYGGSSAWGTSLTAPSGAIVGTSDTQTLTYKTLSTGTVIPVTIGIACSDESTALTTGTAKATFRIPHAMTLTAVRASVGTAPVGSTIIVDINEGGSTIMTTNKLSIDASEKTSTTAATAAGITDTSLANDAEITIDIDQIGSSTAGAGLKIWLIGTRTL